MIGLVMQGRMGVAAAAINTGVMMQDSEIQAGIDLPEEETAVNGKMLSLTDRPTRAVLR